MAELEKLIQECAKSIENQLIAWRRDIHEHPEPGNQEFRTSKLVAEHLRAIDVDEVYEGLCGATGVMGIIHGAKDGPIVGLRCDMDCLPVKEETGLPFASTATTEWGDQGVVPLMHACGHDAHTAMLMATAQVIVALREHLEGKVMLIFQPAEEGCSSSWTGKSGAERYKEEPKYKENHPDVVFGMHVNPYSPKGSAGIVGSYPGTTGYNMDIVRITIKGKSCHGSKPWEGQDTIVCAAHMITALQMISSRDTNANEDSVSVVMGAIKGGNKFNVLAGETNIDGALRFTNAKEKDLIETRLKQIVEHTAKMCNCEATIKWLQWAPAIHNDPKLFAKMQPKLEAVLGDKFSATNEFAFQLLDDYSWFHSDIPGMFFGLSVTYDDKPIANLHESTFAPNEAALVYGVEAMTTAALTYAK